MHITHDRLRAWGSRAAADAIVVAVAAVVAFGVARGWLRCSRVAVEKCFPRCCVHADAY